MEILDLQNADKLGSEFSNYVTGYTKLTRPNLVNDYLIQQSGLPSGDRLSDDYNTTLGFDGEQQSNFQLFGIGKPSAKQIAKRAKKDVNQQITGCVKPKALATGIGGLLLGGGVAQVALLNKYKKDMKAYKACLSNYKAKNQAEADAKNQALAQAQADAKIAQDKLDAIQADPNRTGTEKTTTDDGKIMGIPKTGFYIGVTVLALVGGFIFYKKVIAKK